MMQNHHYLYVHAWRICPLVKNIIRKFIKMATLFLYQDLLIFRITLVLLLIRKADLEMFLFAEI